MDEKDREIGRLLADFDDEARNRLLDDEIAATERTNGAGPEVVEDPGADLPALRFRRSSEIQVEPVRWLWSGRIPLGHLSALAGRGGLGKTSLALWLAARATRGDLDGDLDGPVSVLYVSAEDHESVLTSRLIAAGGDRSRFFVEETGALRLPDHADALARHAVNVGARLIVIDPYSAHSSGDSHRDSDSRQAMGPLHRALAEYDLAAILIMHLNKSESSELFKAISGSNALFNAPRSALLWGCDPGDEDGPLRVLAHGKSNLGVLAPSQSWRMDTKWIHADSGEAMEVGQVVYLGESDVSTSDLLRGSDEQAPERDAARAFLLDHLALGPVRSGEVNEAAAKAKIAEATLKRARKDLKAAGILHTKKLADGWYQAVSNAMPEDWRS